MPTYNFTVRASDDTGAYADRDFSINVKNTVVDRFVLFGGTSAYTSPNLSEWTERPNAAGITFNKRNNGSVVAALGTYAYLPYRTSVFVNGRWFTYAYDVTGGTTNANMKYRLTMTYSDDGVNWSLVNSVNIDGIQFDISGELTDNNSELVNVAFGKLKVYKNKIYSIARYEISGNYVIRLVWSDDGINWTSYHGTNDPSYTMVSALGSAFTPKMFGFSLINNRWHVKFSNLIKISEDITGATWNNVSLPFTIDTRIVDMDVYYFNGMYLIFSNNSTLHTSVDGINWVTRNNIFAGSVMVSSEHPYEITYGNGRLVLTSMINNSASSGTNITRNRVYVSDNGIDWVASTFTSFFGNVNLMIGAPSGASGYTYNPIVFSNGRFILGSSAFTSGSPAVGGLRMSYDGINWTNFTTNIPNEIGAIVVMNP